MNAPPTKIPDHDRMSDQDLEAFLRANDPAKCSSQIELSPDRVQAIVRDMKHPLLATILRHHRKTAFALALLALALLALALFFFIRREPVVPVHSPIHISTHRAPDLTELPIPETEPALPLPEETISLPTPETDIPEFIP